MKRYALILLFFASACNPKLYAPQVEVPRSYLHAEGFRGDSVRYEPQWWTLFRDSTLDTLMARALRNNRDLRIAASRVEEARAQLAVARSEYLPSVDAEVTAGGTYTTPTGTVQKYTAQGVAQWELSLFGELRQASQAARADLLAAEWARRGVLLSLTAQVATTYFQLLGYERNRAIAQGSYALRRESASLIDSMFRYGMTSGVALEQARSQVYTAEADIPSYGRAAEQAYLALCTLMGETPSRIDYSGWGRRLLEDARPAEVPVGLPSELLERRPDIRQAYFTMEAAAHRAKLARRQRFPQIALTGSGGVAADALKSITSSDGWSWSAAGSLTQPLFAFGRLKRRERAAVEAYNQSAYGYEQTVLAAFADVERALVSITTYARQREKYARMVDSDAALYKMTQALYFSGMSDYLNVIDAERELYDSQMQLVNLVVQEYVSYIDLCKALGGGW